jgi:hypothetical protein
MWLTSAPLLPKNLQATVVREDSAHPSSRLEGGTSLLRHISDGGVLRQNVLWVAAGQTHVTWWTYRPFVRGAPRRICARGCGHKSFACNKVLDLGPRGSRSFRAHPAAKCGEIALVF